LAIDFLQPKDKQNQQNHIKIFDNDDDISFSPLQDNFFKNAPLGGFFLFCVKGPTTLFQLSFFKRFTFAASIKPIISQAAKIVSLLGDHFKHARTPNPEMLVEAVKVSVPRRQA
jgi:hypothetical protein